MRMPDGLLLPLTFSRPVNRHKNFLSACETWYTTCRVCTNGKEGNANFTSSLRVCSCTKCPDKNQPSVKVKSNCPLHLLVYKIECHVRAQMADKLIHPVLKRGHSNWLESSHNVLIRYRNNVSTNLGMLMKVTNKA